MSEEKVTTYTTTWLKNQGWRILAFDFPQSGTGFILRPNGSQSKNEGIIIPDIVAIKDNKGLIFENKDHFNLSDFKKINKLRATNDYSNSLVKLFGGSLPQKLSYGAALPDDPLIIIKALKQAFMVDFIIVVTNQDQIGFAYGSF